MGVGTADGVGELEGSNGWSGGECESGTKPAARILEDTMHLASTAPCEWRASCSGEREGLPAVCDFLGGGMVGVAGTAGDTGGDI